ncbi:siderophore-interacting protein [Lentzea sp. BCCO 10_0798]|uniref:Siderophore-interacting protein n=1 Tax=Lentzea kristufekii TaxID=3095430 RepID=A0ABU4U0X1_9PSEU|nr:siderophore-interacting protein [Lentzea sp. BCCO 10_0798]MDX8054213.1 siderophore-interacting protein [Lentzea sp. BCCO 10_0798]
MSRYSAFDRFTLKAATKAAEMMMAPANRREVFDQFVMTVTAVTELGDHMRRITFHAPEFASFAVTGPDEHFGLLMATGRELVMPADDRINVRSSLRAMPEDTRPDLRWYTVRAHRPDVAEIDVDFVVHGDAGPGTRWARRAITGDEAGFRAGGSAYRPPAGGSVLLAADETALPALAAILEVETRPVQVFVEVPDESYRVDLEAEWVLRGDAEPGSAVLKAIQDKALSTVEYAWACGESALATGVRRHLVKDRGVDRKAIMFSGYWKVGSARM